MLWLPMTFVKIVLEDVIVVEVLVRRELASLPLLAAGVEVSGIRRLPAAVCGARQIVLVQRPGRKRPQRRRIQTAGPEPLRIVGRVIEAVVVVPDAEQHLVHQRRRRAVRQVNAVDIAGQEAHVLADSRSDRVRVIPVIHVVAIPVIHAELAS